MRGPRGGRRTGRGRHLAMLLAAAGVVAMGCSAAEGRRTAPAPPDPRVGPPRVQVAVSSVGMVATSSPDAARAGTQVLAGGGNAVDAAVATVLALTATDPAAVGLGGDLVMVIHTADGRDTVIDDPSFVPLRARPGIMAELKRSHNPWQAWGRRGSTVPTALAVLGTALERYGSWEFARVAAPAAGLARRGFELGWYQRSVVNIHRRGLAASDFMATLFLGPGDSLPPVGAVVNRNPALAKTLERLGAAGWRDFYTGHLAREIEADMAEGGGWIGRSDLARALLSVRERAPLSAMYRGRTILVPDTPWGGPSLATALAILQRFPRHLLRSDGVDRLHLQVEAVRLAQYSRGIHRGGFPEGGLPAPSPSSRRRAAELAGLISFRTAVPLERLRAPSPPPMGEHTTQVSVMDRWGNAVSLTGSLGRFFGAKAASPRLGFLYNGFMAGFQYERPRAPGYGRPFARTRGELCPAMVLDNGRPSLVLGTGGSGKIPGLVLAVLSAVLDRGMSLPEAVAFPRVTWSGPAEPEICMEVRPPIGPGAVTELRRRGFSRILAVTYPATVTHRGYLGAVDSVSYDPATGLFTGVGDGRRDGFAAGPQTGPAGSR